MNGNGDNTAVVERLDRIAALLQHLVQKEHPSRLLRLKSAAAYLSISVGTLRTLIQKGEIERVAVAEADHAPWLVDVRTLDEFIQRRKA